MSEQTIESKEVALVKRQATEALSAANDIAIESQEDLEKATDVLSKIKQVGKMIKERKELITRPLMDSLNSVRDLFKPIEQSHAEAESIIKRKMLAFQDEQDRKRREEEARIAARVEKGTMKIETAVRKVEALPTVSTAAQGKVGAISTRIIKKVRIVDESKLPREYLMPDMARINDAALKQSKEIPGVEVYEEKVIAAR